MMKKFTAMLLAAATAATLIACGTTAAPAAAPAAPAAAEETAEPAEEAVEETTEAAPAGETITLQFSSNFAADHPVMLGMQEMADRVKERTNGQLEIVLYPSEQLGSTNDVLDMISIDATDMTMTGSGGLASRIDRIGVFDAPYVFKDAHSMLAFAYSDKAEELWNELAESSNIRVIGAMYNGARYVTCNKEVHTPEDMTGMKLRVPDEPMGLAYGAAMGAKPTPMAFGEVYMALQNGTVDGQENPLVNIINGQFYEVQDYLVQTEHVLANQVIVISDKKYQALPEELRTVLDEELTAELETLTQMNIDNEAANRDFLQENGMTLIVPDVEAFKEATSVVIDDYRDVWGDLYDYIQEME